MDFLHREFDLKDGDLVEVALAGNAANVFLLDTGNYMNYREGKPYKYHGGYVRTSPYRIQPPAPGKWHLVVDLGGGPGKVQASGSVISGSIS